jgi:hypothetical protein
MQQRFVKHLRRKKEDCRSKILRRKQNAAERRLKIFKPLRRNRMQRMHRIPLKERETIEDLKTPEEETECHRPTKLLRRRNREPVGLKILKP